MEYLIGKHIQELRKEKGITQEELGRAAGVSTQAVSKWECGGTPDAELLPVLADYFQVSIDYLYGRDSKEKMNLAEYVEQELQKNIRDEQLDKIFEICLHLQNVVSKLPHGDILPTKEQILPDLQQHVVNYTVIYDDVYSCMRLMEDYHYFLFAPEPAKGFQSVLPTEEEFVSFFKLLGAPHRFAILYFLYGRSNGVTHECLIKNLGISEEDANEALDELIKRELVFSMEIDGMQETMNIYRTSELCSFLPFLIFAGQYMKDATMGYFAFDRKIPLLSKHEEK